MVNKRAVLGCCLRWVNAKDVQARCEVIVLEIACSPVRP
jgi:hypothetical protein